MLHRFLALALFIAAAGCSSGNEDSAGSGRAGGEGGASSGGSTGEPAGGDACTTLSAACLQEQQVCVVDGTEAHCEPCPLGEFADLETSRCAPIAGELWSHEFSEFTVDSGEEILGLCQSWTLNNAEEIWFNAVEMSQNEQSHHSNWMFVPDDRFDGPDGVWSCSERSYSQLEAALAGGVLYAQSTQAAKEVQKFPDGVAVRIPPYSRIIGDVHLLNLATEPATGNVSLRIYQVPREEVTVKLAPFHLTYDTLAIPPQSRSRFYGECDIDQYSRDLVGKPLDLQVYFVLPHTHALGDRFFLEVFGGPNDGQSIIDVSGFSGEARGRFYTPPVDMAGATGFRFGCEFENPRSEEVGWGFDDQEMCENLGFMSADFVFESRVSAIENAGTVDGMPVFTGGCDTLAVPYDHEKPGGPPR